jgi:hypothetical protein
MKHVHVTTFQSETLYASQDEVIQEVRSKEASHVNAFSLIVNKHIELIQQNKLLSRELDKTGDGAKLSRTFNSLSDALDFDVWYKDNLDSFNGLYAALGWTLESTNIISISDERWAEIQPIANVEIQTLIA